MTRDESHPGPLDVRAELRRQRKILAELRAHKAATVERRAAGTWTAGPPIARVRTRPKGKGAPPPGWTT